MSTVHVYFAGGILDGVIQSMQDPPARIEHPVQDKTGLKSVHVYVRTRVEMDHEKDGPYRGRKGVWVFAGESYLPDQP